MTKPTVLSRRQCLAATAALACSPTRSLAFTPPLAPFPTGFVWGAASAALQVEGSLEADGSGKDIWQPYFRRAGVTFANHTPAGGSDHYRRWKEDVGLMKQLGLPSYRFSVPWPRVMPEGTGAVNAKALDHYDRLVDELLRASIDPYVMLYHWELPLALEQKGGWRNRQIVDWFADYASLVTKRLGDRVHNFLTIEEPQVFIGMGYLTGEYAPGHKVSFGEYLNAVHNALLAHGKGCQAVRAHAKLAPTLGVVFGCASFWPAANTKADIEAARKRTFLVEPNKHWNNAWYVDPVLLGKYPEEFASQWPADMPVIKPGDMELIAQPVDYIGINVYNSRPIRASAKAPGWEALVPDGPAQPMLINKQLLCPQGLYWTPKFFWERYKKPLFITENGCGNADWVALDGGVHDPQRVDYLTRFLRELSRAINEGVQVRGYHYWSLLDSFEWDHGYNQRMGLFHVDFGTFKRTAKDSAAFYKELAATNGRNLFPAGAGPR